MGPVTHPEQSVASGERPEPVPLELELELEAVVRLVGGGTVLRCDRDDMAAWLREMMAPAVEFLPGGPAAASVVVHSEPVLGTAPGATGSQPCFAVDTKVEFLPSSGTAGGTTPLRLEHDDKTVSYAIDGDRVTIAPSGPAPDLRVATFMAVRELAVAQALASPTLQLHAAGFASAGRVALLTGPRGAGKTTTLSHLTASSGYAMVTNDRALAFPADDSWEVRGVPTIVGIRSGTMELLPHVFAGAAERTVHLTCDEVPASAAAERRIKPGRVPSMTLAQMARRVGAPLAAGGQLASISVVRIDETVPTFTLRLLDPPEAEEAIYPLRFGRLTEPRPLTVFETMLGRTAPPPFDRALLRRLAATVPCLEVRVGRGLLESPTAGGELAAALLAPAASAHG
jgi:hypothetical protein